MKHRKDYFPKCLLIKQRGFYLPITPGGYNELLSHKEVKEIINGLVNYITKYSDAEIKNFNEQRIKEMFK